jgi:subtilisin family serine protease
MRRIAIVVCLAILFAFVLTTSSPLTGARAQKNSYKYRPIDQPERFVPGRVLVKFREKIMPDHARNIIAALGARDADEIRGLGVHILDLPEQADETGFAQAMAQRPEVEFAELDRIVLPDEVTPNDPWYIDEWHLTKIGAPTAWSSTTGGAGIIVAILDGGVDGSHPDLAPNMVAGWNTYDNTSDTSDPGGHGTKVAGSAVAASNNGIGVAGVAWGCKIMPVRIADSTGATTYSVMAAGLNWAANHGARVANISYTASDSSTVASAAKYFQSKGGVVAMSSGNSSTFDSAADNPYILTVGATDNYDALAPFSSTGNNVDLTAPGVLIRTTARGGGYQSVAGTSFSSPVVAGVAALVISANPTLTGSQVQEILKKSADDLGPTGWDASYGWGRVNAARAVAMAGGGTTVDTTAPLVSISFPVAAATVSGGVTVSVSASDNVGVSSVSLSIDGLPLAIDGVSPYDFQWDTTAVADGAHVLTAIASDAAGNSTSCSVSVNVSNFAVVDSLAPTVVIMNPVAGSTVSGTVSVSASPSDNVGVVKVELYVDGVLTASTTASPFTTKWNTRKAKAGAHVLQCKAYDAAGNVGSSQFVSVYK